MDTIYIDTSRLDGLLKDMSQRLSEREFQQLMYRTLKEVGARVKTITKRAVTRQYEATANAVGKDILRPQMSVNGPNDVSCTIPLQGYKWSIGGNHIKAQGGVPGWAALAYKGHPYPIKAKIVKGYTSVLPTAMEHQGGFAPFRNTSAPRLNNVTFTRNTNKRFPIASVKALAVPEMATNRAEAEINQRVIEFAENRLVHNFEHMFGNL